MKPGRERVQGLVRADKWIAGKATENGQTHEADQAQARADEGVKKLIKGEA